MIQAIAALALASASASSTATLNSTASWWEKVTVTVTDDGNTKSCSYETSLQPTATSDCAVSGKAPAVSSRASSESASSKDQYTRITFERRFSPSRPDSQVLQPGETLLGGQVMALDIDQHGAVKKCRVVATSGSVTPQYGCDEAAAEKFEASAGSARAPARQAYMSIIVYGHSEHVV